MDSGRSFGPGFGIEGTKIDIHLFVVVNFSVLFEVVVVLYCSSDYYGCFLVVVAVNSYWFQGNSY